MLLLSVCVLKSPMSFFSVKKLVYVVDHHLLLSYSPGHDLSAFSNETQMSIDEQMKYDHGLTFDDNFG